MSPPLLLSSSAPLLLPPGAGRDDLVLVPVPVPVPWLLSFSAKRGSISLVVAESLFARV